MMVSMSTPDTNQPKQRKQRRKATTDTGRQILQKERQRLAREQALAAEQMANEAINRENHATIDEFSPSPVTAERLGVSRGIVRRVGAVLASEGVTLPINVRPSERRHDLRAWTDFRTIDVTYENFEDKRLLAATLRGALYHEGGHVRWTIPYGELTKGTRVPEFQNASNTFFRAWNCLEDQRMETAVVSDSPRKAAYFTPMIMTVHTRTLDMAAANYPLLIWRKYLPKRLREHARRAFIALHDVQGKPGLALAEAFERVVTDYVLATNPEAMLAAVVAYHKLLELAQPLASNMNDAGHGHQRSTGYKAKPNLRDDEGVLTIPVSPDMISDDFGGDDVTDEASEEEASDLSLDDLDDEGRAHIFEILIAAWNAPETLVTIQYVLNVPQGQDGDGGQGTPGSLLDDSDEEGPEADDDADTAEDHAADGNGGQQDQADQAEQEGGGTDDDANDDKGVENSPGGSTGSHSNDGSEVTEDEGGSSKDDLTQGELDDMLQEAEEERYNQDDVAADVRAFDEHNNMDGSHLDAYIGGISTNAELIATADYLAEDIERAFHEQTMDKAPSWVEGQRRGMLNVIRYETRNPGEVDFFREWTEDDQPGYNIAVSVLLDYSSSMNWAEEELAQCGYACKTACDRLDIPCTVVLWDTDAKVLFDGTERAEHLPVLEATGGTDPSTALADLDNQRMNRPIHIVLIMTDGEWDEEWGGNSWNGRVRKATRSLTPYKDEGRTIIGFGFGRPTHDNTTGLAHGLMAKGCDEAFGSHNLMDLPEQLERILLAYA